MVLPSVRDTISVFASPKLYPPTTNRYSAEMRRDLLGFYSYNYYIDDKPISVPLSVDVSGDMVAAAVVDDKEQSPPSSTQHSSSPAMQVGQS